MNDRYGRLTVISKFKEGKYTRLLCRCDCGALKKFYANHVINKKSTSCGCYNSRLIGDRSRTHGKSGTTEYWIWCHMIRRCHNKKNPSYKNYGARGIYVCKEWFNFSVFYRDMGDRPIGASLDRIDNNGPYSKDNCRWATKIIQANNKRNNTLIEYNGSMKPIMVASRESGIPIHVLRGRLKLGWDHKRIFMVPPRKLTRME